MSTFQLKPKLGEKYKAKLNIQIGEIIEKELPNSLENGVMFELIPEANNQLPAIIRATNEYNNLKFYLVAHTKGIFKIIEIQILKNNEAKFLIDKNKLGDGISQIAILNDKGQTVCERLYF